MMSVTMLHNSKEGMAYLMDGARRWRLVMPAYHRKLAEKYGISTEGVIFSDPIPVRGES